ncbi:MFS transporter [Streptomyces afghaniensis]|uniref:MFS transporter n=1 Tax=Streptomyces afghaniensis TaxID=66865 RepID=UPI00278143D3|nr:MFS transporter [Streptomyces afghaniensis]MDQ1017856.1 EmrB/QacA subfamily drug resistance transporter [Streptomyces afghaniensis]
MSTSKATAEAAAAAPAKQAKSSAVVLGVILICQLMIGLDATIMNVAIPKVQEHLHFSPTGVSWVLNAYALAFGGLVLLGGRCGDILGRRRVFMTGVVLFTVASLLGGLATADWHLVAARAVQGFGAALAAPSALALLMINFPDVAQRTRALALYSITMALGTTVGLILGGVLVSWTSWRWVLFVNVPVGVVIALLTPKYVRSAPPRPGRFDVGGAAVSTLGVGLLIYGFIHASTEGWTDARTIGVLVAAVVLLAIFLAVESRVEQPVTPLHLFRSRNRAAGYIHIFLLMATMYGLYFFGTQFMERVLDFSPFRTGMAFLVTTLAATIAARGVGRLLPSLGAKPILIAGAASTLVGSAWMTQLSATSGYLSGLIGPLFLFGLGMGLSMPALNVTILAGVSPQESGAAAGLLQAMQFVGGTIGLSVLVTVFGGTAKHVAANPPSGSTARNLGDYVLADGIASAYVAGVVFTACTLIVAALVVKAAKPIASS